MTIFFSRNLFSALVAVISHHYLQKEPSPTTRTIRRRPKTVPQNPSCPDLVQARDLMHYAQAAYGSSFRFLCRGNDGGRRVKHLMCCGCCHRGSGSVEGDGSLCSNAAAIRAYLPHLDDDDIIHISFINREATRYKMSRL